VCGLKFMRVDSGVGVPELFSQCKNIKIYSMPKGENFLNYKVKIILEIA